LQQDFQPPAASSRSHQSALLSQPQVSQTPAAITAPRAIADAEDNSQITAKPTH